MVFYDLEWLSIFCESTSGIMVSDRLVALAYPLAIRIQLAGWSASDLGWHWHVFTNEAGRDWAHSGPFRWNLFRHAPQIVLPLWSRSSDIIIRDPLDALAFVESISWL